MSHSVTITRTTTSSNSTSALILNTGYLKTLPGLLKLAQLIIGAVCVGLVYHYYTMYSVYRNYHGYFSDLFVLLMVTTFLIGTFCLLVSCLFSLSTGGIISKTIYELIYHSIAFVLLACAAILLLVNIQNYKNTHYYDTYIVVGVLVLVNAILYLVSAILARRSYRGI